MATEKKKAPTKKATKAKESAPKKAAEPKAKASSSTTDRHGITYHKMTISCACGAVYESGSIKESIRVDICANCHPFFTGENKIVDAEGRVDKFLKKYNMAKG